MFTWLSSLAAVLLWTVWATTTNLWNYIASSNLTISLNSLASSSTWTAGRSSTAVDNTTNKYLDYALGGKIKAGTSPSSGTQIRVYVVSMINDSTWPDTFDGTDKAVTLTTAGAASAAIKLAAVCNVDATTTGEVYYFGMQSVASLFGGICPPKFQVWVTHNTGVALDASAGGTVSVTPVDTTNG